VLLALTVLVASSAGAEAEAPPGHPSHHVDGGFRNTNPAFQRPDLWTLWSFLLRQSWRSVVAPVTFDAPRVPNDGRALRDAQAAPTIAWIGHSTLLIQIDGLNVLTDPNWGERASPLSWAGPRRLSPPGLAFEDLPKIDVVLISHDHYDHLDLGTVKRLAVAHDPLFLVPLGLKAWFADNDMTHVAELDWWGTHEQGSVRFVCTPAQHFSQRTPWDRNKRLWASWAVLGTSRRLYFGGDSGYFDGFKETGERLGPFDLAAIAIGAYRPAGVMQFTHTTPEQAVAAFEDLRAHVLLGIHWGTFVLSEEPIDEPPARMLAETTRRGIDGERAWIFKLGETRRW
jgi:L-ascorbate metabolism protein UlaG (beta-lactamase superfamily)